jgi:1,4-dihydroxy-2-naphthoyl-CoA synthase
MQYEDVTCELRNGAARITIDRPQKMNALREKRKPDFHRWVK